MNNAAALENVFKQKILLTLSHHKEFQGRPPASVIYKMWATQNCNQYREGGPVSHPTGWFYTRFNRLSSPISDPILTQSQVSSQGETQTMLSTPKKEEGG